jgi:hypothetical protein
LNHCWRLKYRYAKDDFGQLYLDSDTPIRVSSYCLANLLAVSDAANVIAFSLLLLVSPATNHQSHNCRTQLHARSVLFADAYIDSNYITAPGGGSLLMAFALKIVGLWAPLQEQKDRAIIKLQNWDPDQLSHGSRKFAGPVFFECSTQAEPKVSNVYYINVAKEISRRRPGQVSCNNGPMDDLWWGKTAAVDLNMS